MTTSTTDSARDALRREHNVALVSPSQEGFAAEHLPDGVYGFTSSPALASPLFAIRHHRNFEIHRMANGVIAVIGFVTPAEASQLAHDRQVEPVTSWCIPMRKATRPPSSPCHTIASFIIDSIRFSTPRLSPCRSRLPADVGV